MENETPVWQYAPVQKGPKYYEQAHRYAAAGAWCRGKRVLDITCGDGFGSALLARSAASVVGTDRDANTIAHASAAYSGTNLQFVVAEPTSIPLADGSVDVVTCFDTVDDIEEREALFAEILRVLAPGGLLFISSPNKRAYLENGGLQDPFQVDEYYYESFRGLLKCHFENVALLGQRLAVASVIHPLGGGVESNARWYAGDTASATDGLPALAGAEHFLAVCSSGALPVDLASSFIDRDVDLLEVVRHESNAGAVPRKSIGETRLMVACAPKSGSTYVANVLGRYFEARVGNSGLHEMQWDSEQNLTRYSLTALGGGSYVIQLHLRPYSMNFKLMQEFGIDYLVHWRNLGDMIVSLDDHIKKAETGERQPLSYIHDKDAFLAMERQARYRYLIQTALRWYLAFYLAWRKEKRPIGVYERMVEDQQSFFEETIARLLGDVDGAPRIDSERLAEILAVPSGFTNHNVGRYGRSAELFSEETRRLLEEAVLNDPAAADLEILLWELPWEVPALAPTTKYDGTIVLRDVDSAQFFVSRGIRHLIPSDKGAWLASRWRLRNQPISVLSAAQCNAIPEGAPLT